MRTVKIKIFLITCLIAASLFYVYADEAENIKMLRFRKDGTFKIVQITDIHGDRNADRRTTALIESVCDDQQPDLVILTGDNITGNISDASGVKKAIDGFAGVINSRGMPWLITFGNHDDEHAPRTGMDKKVQLDYYMSYSNNINIHGPDSITGIGNMYLFIFHSNEYIKTAPLYSDAPAFIIWALDSGTYSDKTIAGQNIEGLNEWDWIRHDQIDWYIKNSIMIEERFGKLPGFMFFHIPLFEFSSMWNNKEKHNVIGEKNENISHGMLNSGMFSAMLNRGDIKGVFCGHDHANNFIGNYYGIFLGYAASTGFRTYGLKEEDKHRLRGARVFILNENYPDNFKTYMVYAQDYGIQ